MSIFPLDLEQKILLSLARLLQVRELQVRTSQTWSSKAPEFRHRLREQLARDLKTSSPLVVRDITNITAPPKFPKTSISISHCRLAGGYAMTPLIAGQNIGFDMEENIRVTESLVRRVSAPSEVDSAPYPASLWCAKESAYKALRGPNQPKTLINVSVSNWQGQSENLWTFEFQENTHNSQGRGVIYRLEDISLGFSLKVS